MHWTSDSERDKYTVRGVLWESQRKFEKWCIGIDICEKNNDSKWSGVFKHPDMMISFLKYRVIYIIKYKNPYNTTEKEW